MNRTLTQVLCRFLAVALMLLPYQTGQASMIGTDLAAAPAGAQADRNAISSFLSRAQTVSELQSLGLDPQLARDRVAAMTDAEVSSLAGKINALPAGGDGLVLVLLLVLIIFLVVYRR
ncbi:MAG TPA: PA2779 family protein [Burkholderiales bacterium]|nr:PA2779 family protein [Burkholderiales bacterium]